VEPKEGQALSVTNPTPRTFSDLLRVRLKWAFDPAGAFLVRIGLTPNFMTFLGLAGSALAAAFLARDQLVLGGLLVLITAPIDTLDGAMARAQGGPSEFGGFIDSVSDRYAELFIFGGLLYNFLVHDNHPGALLTFAAAGGSVLVSYVKARAEGFGFDARGGLLTRLERFLILIPALLTGQVLIGLGLIAVLANFTAVQRMLSVRAQSRARAAARGAELQ
jgi:CDP-diacylglycerol--glycerol-3-phosphate 3-phosphatidyltransferase